MVERVAEQRKEVGRSGQGVVNMVIPFQVDLRLGLMEERDESEVDFVMTAVRGKAKRGRRVQRTLRSI